MVGQRMRPGGRGSSRWTSTAPWSTATACCRLRSARRSTLVVAAGVPVVLSHRALLARHQAAGRRAGPAAGAVGLLQRRGDRDLPAAGDRQGDHLRPPRRDRAGCEEFAPGTLIAVEEIGVGYRLNDHFPGGDLTGEMIIEDVEQLSARPVTRVILRDPTRSDEDFISLARHLGLHGVTYFVGWSAWLDIAPEGVNKATALAEVAEGLGVSARPTCWPSATAATTSRCSAGPAAAWRSAMPPPRSRRRPTTSPPVRRRRPGRRAPPLVRLAAVRRGTCAYTLPTLCTGCRARACVRAMSAEVAERSAARRCQPCGVEDQSPDLGRASSSSSKSVVIAIVWTVGPARERPRRRAGSGSRPRRRTASRPARD